MALFTGTQQSYYQGADNNFNTSDDLNTYGNYQFVNIKDLITNLPPLRTNHIKPARIYAYGHIILLILYIK